MFQLIEKLRQKPERVKNRVAFLTALFVCGIILVIWTTVVFPDLKRDRLNEDAVTKAEPSPISTFFGAFSSSWKDISEQFSQIKETVSNLSSGSEYYSATSTETLENITP